MTSSSLLRVDLVFGKKFDYLVTFIAVNGQILNKPSVANLIKPLRS